MCYISAPKWLIFNIRIHFYAFIFNLVFQMIIKYFVSVRFFFSFFDPKSMNLNFKRSGSCLDFLSTKSDLKKKNWMKAFSQD
jgi:hypothetical protein